MIIGYCGFCERPLERPAGEKAPGRPQEFHADSCRQRANRFSRRYRDMVAFAVYVAHKRAWPAERPRPLGAPVIERLVKEVMDAW